MLGTQEAVFHFADIEVREREFRLIKAGEVVPVEPKAFRVLLMLLRNPQKLITKEELLDTVWGDTAVSENSLTRSIALLRRLLGEDTHEPRLIETVATVGYRFVCPVEVSEDTHGGLASPNLTHVGNGTEPAQTDGGSASEAVTVKASWTARRRRLIATTVLAVGILASVFWYLSRPLPPPHITDIVQMTHDHSRKWLAGTDGARFYFGRWSGSSPTAEVAVSGGEDVPVPTGLPPPGPWVMDVSPDGSALLVCSPNSVGGGLWSVQIPGGSLRHLTDSYCVTLIAAWSPDGKSVVYPKQDGGIYVVRTDGSNVHRLGSVKEVVGDLTWSPNGQLIRFTLNHRIWEMSSDGSGIHELLPGWRPLSWQRSGHWTPDGRFFEFWVWDAPLMNYPNDAPYQLWILDERRGLFRRTAKEPVQLTQGPIRWDRPYPSRDGKKIFVRGIIKRGELNRYDPETRQLEPYLGGISAEHVSFSPGGQFMAYVTFPDGILWRANRDGSSPTQLATAPLYPFKPLWSPDSTKILFFASDAEGKFKSYILPSKGGAPQPVLPEDKESQSDPSWSPDGRKVVFCHGADQKSDIRIIDLASHQVITIPESSGIYSPRWSPDGRFIAALQTVSWTLKVFDLETQRWSLLDEQMDGYPTWSRDGRFIYFLTYGREVRRIRPSGGDAERVVDLRRFPCIDVFSCWMGLDSEDTPMLLRDVGIDDIYALTLEEK